MSAATPSADPRLTGLLQDERVLVWSFIGDSVTAAGWHTWGARGFAELFHERLRELGRRRDGVVNTGVSGWRVGDLHDDLDEVCLRYRPDAVVIGTGLNDTRGGREGAPRFGREYRRLVERIRDETGAVVVTQTPNTTLPSGPGHVVDALPAYVDEIRAAAEELDTVLVDHYAVWSATDDDTAFEWYAHGCHPNAYGHRAMARTLLQRCGAWDPASRSGRLTIP